MNINNIFKKLKTLGLSEKADLSLFFKSIHGLNPSESIAMNNALNDLMALRLREGRNYDLLGRPIDEVIDINFLNMLGFEELDEFKESMEEEMRSGLTEFPYNPRLLSLVFSRERRDGPPTSSQLGTKAKNISLYYNLLSDFKYSANIQIYIDEVDAITAGEMENLEERLEIDLELMNDYSLDELVQIYEVFEMIATLLEHIILAITYSISNQTLDNRYIGNLTEMNSKLNETFNEVVRFFQNPINYFGLIINQFQKDEKIKRNLHLALSSIHSSAQHGIKVIEHLTTDNLINLGLYGSQYIYYLEQIKDNVSEKLSGVDTF